MSPCFGRKDSYHTLFLFSVKSPTCYGSLAAKHGLASVVFLGILSTNKSVCANFTQDSLNSSFQSVENQNNKRDNGGPHSPKVLGTGDLSHMRHKENWN